MQNGGGIAPPRGRLQVKTNDSKSIQNRPTVKVKLGGSNSVIREKGGQK
jgi:hypothetical protein